MPKYIIDTDAGTVTPYTNANSGIGERMVAILQAHRGEVEYTGFCKTVQEWFYGTVVESAWCATAISYLAEQTGLLTRKEGDENVFWLMETFRDLDGKKGTFYSTPPQTIQKGDILFWLWEGDKMTFSSKKHVGLAEYNSASDKIYCIGGNQKNKVCTLEYDRKYLYAVFRPY